MVQGDFEPESGYRAMQQILSQQHRPTAIFCGGDIMAMGAICAADEMGLRRSAGYFADWLLTTCATPATLARR
nr:purine nucleotide synthesis repressor [Raoultella sp. NCTC 9187]